MSITIGEFIESNYIPLGLGKVIGISDQCYTIEYFESIASRIIKVLPFSQAKRVSLEEQTRCYIYDEKNDLWLIGRIEGRDGDQYDVALPNETGGYFDVADIFVRCNKPIADPTEILAVKGQETAFFYERRSRFVREVVKQRAISRGMSGLISSGISLYPHQVEVIRRVLEDPVQRYLLADEVGLGKTIEAGVIVKQFLLDNHKKEAVIIVPMQLEDQWCRELQNKFGLKGFKRLFVISMDQIDYIKDHKYDLVVIDEAQHIAGKAFSNRPSDQTEYLKYKRLCHDAESLLLLSATPVLNHEDAFLAMLHLLDPDNYALSDIDSFRDKVNNRQNIGRMLLSFSEGNDPFIINRNLKKIADTFPDDMVLNELLIDVKTELDLEASDMTKCNQLIRTVRLHISDTYRLYRRMLRNRRDSIKGFVLPGRNDDEGQHFTTTECDLNPTIDYINDLLDAWRDAAYSELLHHADQDTEEYLTREKELAELFVLFFETSGSSIDLFREVLLIRLEKKESDSLRRDIGDANMELLYSADYFANEMEIEEELIKLVENGADEGDRIDLLIEVLKKERNNKCVIFTSFPSVGQKIKERLLEAFGSDYAGAFLASMNPSDLRMELLNFAVTGEGRAMVLDASGEEGLNLQMADIIIHYDLPWSPNRIEQRIGRVDRIGNDMRIRSYVFIGPDMGDSLYDTWYRILKEGIGVFDKSIASLQFYIDKKLPELTREFLVKGVNMVSIVDEISVEIIQEKEKINEQQVLDEIDALTENAKEFFQPLFNYESDPKAIYKSIDPWISKALIFEKKLGKSHICDYKNTSRTLVPKSRLYQISKERINKGTYDRDTSKMTGHPLYRIGNHFIDSLYEYIDWDDRGKVFAIWRYIPAWGEKEAGVWLGYRFDYVVETDTSAVESETVRMNKKAVRRVADAYFPPQFKTIFIGVDLKEALDQELLGYLGQPFNKEYDTNLIKDRMEILHDLIDSSIWPNLCRQAYEESQSKVRVDKDLRALCSKCAEEVQKGFEKRIMQLQLRLMDEETKVTGNKIISVSQKDIESEKLIKDVLFHGIIKPRITLDSVGFIFLADKPIRLN